MSCKKKKMVGMLNNQKHEGCWSESPQDAANQ